MLKSCPVGKLYPNISQYLRSLRLLVINCFMISVILFLLFSNGLCSITNDYPDVIPVFNVRTDVYSKSRVTSGHLHGLKSKSSLKEFKERLQCSSNEPDFDYNSGSLSLLRSIPPTKDIVELMCAHAEKKCVPWSECRRQRTSYLTDNSSIPNAPFQGFIGFQGFKMYRVINGALFYDWPWRISRFNYRKDENFKESNEVLPLMKLVLDKVHDIPDSVFFVGSERPSLPFDFPFPIFSHATSLTFTDMPWPWLESFRAARSLYHTVLKEGGNFAYDNEKSLEESRSLWISKKSKAAFFGSYDEGRERLYDACRRYPDMFEAAFGFPMRGIRSWHPMSPLDVFTDSMKATTSKEDIQNASTWTTSGYALSLVSMTKDRPYNPKDFKYVIVPMGSTSLSTSGRLAGLLATSGAVILLQRTHLVYHFSARLKPWVHYVPLTYSGADVVEKVQWLRDHDDLARQIAENGRAFARSYLRLEDYYCYAAAALEVVGELEKGSDALQPFNPRPMGPLNHHIAHVNVTENEG